MLTTSQTISIILFVASTSIVIADASVDIESLYSPSHFIPLSLNTVVQYNGTSEKGQVLCYDFPGSCNGAVCCDNGSCAGKGQVCCGIGVCDGVTCCENGCVGTGQTCCGAGSCDVGYGCCENKACVADSDTCCVDGSHCPAGYGCFAYDNSNHIFCSPTSGGIEPATLTIPAGSTSAIAIEPTTPALSGPNSVATASSSIYYFTYEYEWTTSYYVYEVESFTTYIVTTVLPVTATDSAAASSFFDEITATASITAPPTLLPGGSAPSQLPSGQTEAALTSSTAQSSATSFGASKPNAAPSAKLRGRSMICILCTISAMVMITIIITI